MPIKTSDGKWKWGNVTRDTKKELAQTVYGIWKSNGSKGSFHDFYYGGHKKLSEQYSFLVFNLLSESHHFGQNDLEFLYPTLSELEREYKTLDGAGEEDMFIKCKALPRIKKEMIDYVNKCRISKRLYMDFYKKLEDEYKRIMDTYGSKDEEDLGKILDKSYFTNLADSF